MITKLLNEVNEKIETLNNLVQNKEYFEKLEERIEKVNNHIQEQQKEIERLNNIINKAIEWCETCYCEITNVIGEKRKMISSENIIDILKGVDK